MKMSETDRIKNALVNVSTLAHTSDYYNPDRDSSDIELIEKIVKKEIAQKPDFVSDGHAYGYPIYDIWICPSCGTIYDIYSSDYDYCPNCGQRIEWEEQQ